MESKGTLTLEFLITIFVCIIICSMIVSVTIEEFKSIEETQNRKEARLVSDDISQTINKVNINGDGYSVKYRLPSKINNETYIVKINESGVYINSHYQLTYTNIIPGNNLRSKTFILLPDNTYEFKNNNKTIDIIQVN